jgi:hypothetical protein
MARENRAFLGRAVRLNFYGGVARKSKRADSAQRTCPGPLSVAVQEWDTRQITCVAAGCDGPTGEAAQIWAIGWHALMLN